MAPDRTSLRDLFGGTDLLVVGIVAGVVAALLLPEEFGMLIDGLEAAVLLFLVFFGLWFALSFVWLLIVRPLLEHVGVMKEGPGGGVDPR